MPDTNPTQEPDDLPILFNLPMLLVDDHGVPVDLGDALTVVTVDGRPLRIVSVRSLSTITAAGIGGHRKAEITVAEEAG